MRQMIDDLRERRYLFPSYDMVSECPFDPGQSYNTRNPMVAAAHAVPLMGTPPYFKWHSFYSDCTVRINGVMQWGLFRRHPYEFPSNTSKDELICAAAIDQDWAKDILRYGQSHFWYFDTEFPSKWVFNPFRLYRYFKARFIDLVPFVRLRATGKMNLLDRPLWALACRLSCLPGPKEMSGKLLMQVQIPFVAGKYPICDRAIKFWRKTMTRKYPGGAKQLRTEYFGANHPVSERSRVDWN